MPRRSPRIFVGQADDDLESDGRPRTPGRRRLPADGRADDVLHGSARLRPRRARPRRRSILMSRNGRPTASSTFTSAAPWEPAQQMPAILFAQPSTIGLELLPEHLDGKVVAHAGDEAR